MMFSGSWKEVVAWLGLELTDPISWAVLSSYCLEEYAADCLLPLVQGFMSITRRAC